MKKIILVITFCLFFVTEKTQAVSWEEPVPTVFNSQIALDDKDQPGSRLFYLSNEGDDATASIYFWNGTNIVDSNGNITGEGEVAYGTDPMNPSGPIKPFKRWSYVAPRGSGWGEDTMVVGYPWDGTSYRAPGGNPVYRYGYPDWWLFKRGETFDLYQDYLSFAQETVPSLTEITGGSLVLGGGESETKRQVMGAYGDLASARPRFINSANSVFISRGASPVPKHILYQSLHFDGRGDIKNGGISFLSQTVDAADILFEDVWVDGTNDGVYIQLGSPEITFRKCLITDVFKATDTSHTQGVYLGGNEGMKFRIEDSYLLRNGFNEGDPATAWPPTGNQVYNIYNRNMYLSGNLNHMASGVFNSVSMIGASGDQFRPGMRIEGNFFYQGYLSMGGKGGEPDSVGPTGSFKDNVLQRFSGRNTDDNRGQPNWGFDLTSGANQVEVSGNIITGAQYEAGSYALNLGPLSWYCYNHTFRYPTRNNNIFNNIFDSGSAQAAINVVDGVDTGSLVCSNWSYPGVINNTVDNNILINSNSRESIYVPVGPAVGTSNDTEFSNNRIYASRDQASSALEWLDSERTLKSYMQYLGYTVNSDDGFIEYFTEVTKQRRGYFREELTSNAIVNYFREGFGIEPLEIEGTILRRGDVDNNDAINTTDALLTLRNSLGLSMASTAWQTGATTGDVDCNGISNSTDALLILRYSLGLSMDGTAWCEIV